MGLFFFLIIAIPFGLLVIWGLKRIAEERAALHALTNLHPGATYVPGSKTPMYSTDTDYVKIDFKWGGGVKLNHGGYSVSLYRRKVRRETKRGGKRSILFHSGWAVGVELHRGQTEYSAVKNYGLLRSNVFTQIAEAEERQAPYGVGTIVGSDRLIRVCWDVKGFHDLLQRSSALIEILPSSSGAVLLYSFAEGSGGLTSEEWLFRMQCVVDMAEALDGATS